MADNTAEIAEVETDVVTHWGCQIVRPNGTVWTTADYR